MIVKVTLSGMDVQNILLKHVEKLSMLPYDSRSEYLAVYRVGDAPPTFEVTVEVKQNPTDER